MFHNGHLHLQGWSFQDETMPPGVPQGMRPGEETALVRAALVFLADKFGAQQCELREVLPTLEQERLTLDVIATVRWKEQT